MTSHGFKQNEISQEQTMRTNFFKRRYFTVLGVLSFETICILVKSTTMVLGGLFYKPGILAVNNPPNIIWFIQSYSWAELARTMVLFIAQNLCSDFSLIQFKILFSITILSFNPMSI
jgi:hypothetical protein